MADRIPVLYLAPILHVPRRAREARLSYVPQVAQATLRELGDADHVEGPRIPLPGNRWISTRLVDGEAWRPVETRASGKASLEIDAPTFREWLSGKLADATELQDLEPTFAATPLVARLPRTRGLLRDSEWNAAAEGAVTFDARERALRRATDYVEGDVALLSGVPHQRMRGPLAFHDDHVGKLRIVRFPGAPTSYAPAQYALPFRVDQAGEHAAFAARFGHAGGPIPSEWDAAAFDGVRFARNDEIAAFAADATRWLVDNMERLRRDENPHPPDRALRIVQLHALSSVGMLNDGEIEEACEIVRPALADHVAAEPDRPGVSPEQRWALSNTGKALVYAETHALPALRARNPLVQEDVEHLAGMTL